MSPIEATQAKSPLVVDLRDNGLMDSFGPSPRPNISA
jgi:hypothetical protein